MMYDWGGQGWSGQSWGIVGWIVMGLVMVLFWGTIITVAVMLLRRSAWHRELPSGGQAQPGAERILDERFARGEIDEPEYTARRTALRAKG
jgi:putative membrane protein